MAYAFSNSINLKRVFIRSDQTAHPQDEKAELDEDNEPKIPDGLSWYTHVAALDFKLTQKMEDFISGANRTIGEVREGTIGEYVKNHF